MTKKAAVPSRIKKSLAKKKSAPNERKSRRGYGGLTPQEQDNERRERLLSTALELFTKQGYQRTPIEQLCAESKVTSRYFYQLYETREALLTALFDKIISRTQAAMVGALSKMTLKTEDRIAEAIEAFVHAYAEDARCARICVLEAVGVSTALEKHRRVAIHEFAQIIKMHADLLAQAGMWPKRDYHLLSVAMVGGTNEMLAEWLTVKNPPSIKVLINEIQLLFQIWVRGLITVNS
jgi:AcrR family transcriptional regulator